MDRFFEFGLNLYIQDTQYLKQALQSIVKDESFFVSDIHLVLLDTLEDEESIRICDSYLKRFPDNIVYVKAKGQSMAQAYNQALEITKGNYVNFTLSSTIYGDGTFQSLKQYVGLHQDSIVSIHTKFFDPDKGDMEKMKRKETVYDLKEQLCYLPLFLNRYFISVDIAKQFTFKEELHEDCRKEFLLQVFYCQDQVTIVKNTNIYYCDPQERSLVRYPFQTMRWWYLDQMRDMILPLLRQYQEKGAIPLHIQSLILYLIEIKFYFNRNMRYKYIIRKDEVQEFFALVQEALGYIDPMVILNNSVKAISPLYLCYRLLCMRKGVERIAPEFKKGDDGKEWAFVDGLPFTPVDKMIVSEQLFETIPETKERRIKCELFFNYLADPDTMDFKAEVNGQPFEIEMDDKNNEVKYFGVVLRNTHVFYINIPKEKRRLHNKLRFTMTIDGTRRQIRGKIAKKKLLASLKRKIKNGRLCPFFQYMREWQYILLYVWYRLTTKQLPDRVAMLSDSRAELSGNLAFIDEELKKNGYTIDYFFKRSLKEEKTTEEKKRLCKLMATSKYILVDDFYPIIYALPLRKGTRLIQVWHAMGAFKTVGFSRLGKPGGPNPRSISHRNYTDAITSAAGICCNYAEAFNMPGKDVHATGIPRTDIFFDPEYIKETKARLYAKYPRLKGKKVVMFAPTFRGNGQNSAYYNFDWIDFAELQESLGEDVQFIIKLHPFIKNIDSVPKDNKFFLDLTSEREINDLLFITDVLITDYSSVIFEASLLNINTIFYAPDLEEYTESRDFYYPFNRYTFGKIAKDMPQLIDAIQHSENDEEKLQEFKEHFCGACDGHATKRFVDMLFDKVK